MNKVTSNALTILVLSLIAATASCQKLDVVGNYSIQSFDELLKNSPQLVSEDTENKGWSFSAPDNSARFFWSRDFAESPHFDVMIEFDSGPFIAAGLDSQLLPADFAYNDNTIAIGAKLGTENFAYKSEITPLASYEQLVNLKRSSIGYHAAMDHYGISLGGGHVFEWAKNLSTNDKDIVFVLDPEPFINAGVDPDKIEGWIFTKVPVEDDKGKMIEADKILKPFDLM